MSYHVVRIEFVTEHVPEKDKRPDGSAPFILVLRGIMPGQEDKKLQAREALTDALDGIEKTLRPEHGVEFISLAIRVERVE